MRVKAKKIHPIKYTQIGVDIAFRLKTNKWYTYETIQVLKLTGTATEYYYIRCKDKIIGRWYPVEWFYTEKEVHSLKFNSKVGKFLGEESK